MAPYGGRPEFLDISVLGPLSYTYFFPGSETGLNFAELKKKLLATPA